MAMDFRERGRWLARHILPFEPVIRARLSRVYVCGLEIDDIIQEMYARILSVPSLDAIRYPRQYAMQTAKSIIIDHIRHSRVISIASGESLDHLDVATPEGSAEERLEFRDEIEEVADALSHMSARGREILILRRIEGLSQKETANRLRISEKTVEKYMTRSVWLLMSVFGRGGKSRPHTSEVIGDARSEDDDIKSRD